MQIDRKNAHGQQVGLSDLTLNVAATLVKLAMLPPMIRTLPTEEKRMVTHGIPQIHETYLTYKLQNVSGNIYQMHLNMTMVLILPNTGYNIYSNYLFTLWLGKKDFKT